MQCLEKGVPVVIVSAGISDVIEGILLREGVDTSRVLIISNKMQFNGDGILVGFDDHLVHSRNKKLCASKMQPYFDSLFLVRSLSMFSLCWFVC